MRNALDIDPAGRDIRRHEDLVPPAPEPRERRLPLALAAVSVDPSDVETGRTDLAGHAVRAPLRPHEDEDRHHVLPTEEPDEEGGLQVLGDRVDFVTNRRGRPMGWRDGDADGIAHDRSGKGLDLGRHRGGKQERLAVSRKGANDPPNVRKESHVEHAVRLIEDEDLETAEVHVPAGHVVEEPARRRDHDIDSRAEGVFLRRHSDAAVHGMAADPRPLREAAEGDFNLGCKLAGRGEDEGAGFSGWLLEEPLKDWEEKRRRLAGTGLGRPDHIPASKDRRNRLALDRSWGLIAKPVDGSHQGGIQAEIREGRSILHRVRYGVPTISVAELRARWPGLIASGRSERRGRSKH